MLSKRLGGVLHASVIVENRNTHTASATEKKQII